MKNMKSHPHFLVGKRRNRNQMLSNHVIKFLCAVAIQWSQTCLQASLSAQSQETHYSVSDCEVVSV